PQPAKNRRGNAPPVPLPPIQHSSELGFELHQLFYRKAHLVLATELRTEHFLAGMVDIVSVSLCRQRYVLYLAYQRLGVFHVELDKVLNFLPVQRLGVDIDEYWA